MGMTRNNAFYPDVFIDAVKGAFKGRKALAGTGAVALNRGLPTGLKGGDTIKVPYFGVLGELQVTAEDVAVPLGTVAQTNESATVRRAGRAFEMSRWKQIAESSNDPYGEFSSQLVQLVQRAWDGALIDVCFDSTGMPASQVVDRYNAGTPDLIDYDHIVSGRAGFGDEQDGIAMMVMHSKPYFDLMKQVDGELRPLLTNPNDGGLVKVAGVPVMPSDRCRIDYSGSSAMLGAGTTPNAVTVTGSTNMGINQLLIDVVAGGTVGAMTFRYSYDGGTTWSSTVTSAASVALLIDNDSTKPTGLTVNFPAATYDADETYTGRPRYWSAIVKQGALGLWYNDMPSVDTDKDILKDNVVAAIHSYFAPLRYGRIVNDTRPGVILLGHN